LEVRIVRCTPTTVKCGHLGLRWFEATAVAGAGKYLACLSGSLIRCLRLEIGNWIGGDQVSGRIVQLPVSKVFGNPIFNYTQNFNYIWDEVVLLITYDSNLDSATRTLVGVGGEYTKEYLKGAEAELEKLRQNFWGPASNSNPRFT
jgi:hypothetical protein